MDPASPFSKMAAWRSRAFRELARINRKLGATGRAGAAGAVGESRAEQRGFQVGVGVHPRLVASARVGIQCRGQARSNAVLRDGTSGSVANAAALRPRAPVASARWTSGGLWGSSRTAITRICPSSFSRRSHHCSTSRTDHAPGLNSKRGVRLRCTAAPIASHEGVGRGDKFVEPPQAGELIKRPVKRMRGHENSASEAARVLSSLQPPHRGRRPLRCAMVCESRRALQVTTVQGWG